jgi:DNA-3-methyladenine glycosylase II
MARLIAAAGPLELRPPSESYFAALARAIVFQQLAGAAARAIHGRFAIAVGGEVTATAVLAAPPEALRGAGLSAAKSASITDLAARVDDGTVPLDGIERLDDDDIVARLSQVRGIGRWTAEMFLLFDLRRADVWPVDDLGVRQGWRLMHDQAEMLKPKELQLEGERFKPFRSVAAWYCWQAVHLHRGQVTPR